MKKDETKKPKSKKAKKGVVVTMRKTKNGGMTIKATSHDGTDLRNIFPDLLK